MIKPRPHTTPFFLWLLIAFTLMQARAQTNLNFAQVLQRAKAGDEEAQFRLGRFYVDGYFNGGTNAFVHEPGLMPNFAEAVKWLVPLAEKGHARAQNNLGYLCLYGYVGSPDPEKARQWFGRAMAGGDYKATRNLASMYRRGQGGPADKAKANELEIQATLRLLDMVTRGDPDDEYNLGICYLAGEGIAADRTEGMKWILKSLHQGNPLAELKYGKMAGEPNGPATTEEGLTWVRAAAAKGLPAAQGYLGWRLCLRHTTEQESVEGRALLRQAAERGHIPSMYDLGMVYWNGYGMKSDQVESLIWMRKAAETGHTLGEFETGYLLLHGKGVQKDPTEAVHWLMKGVEKGFDRAQYRLGDCYMKGIGGLKKDHVEAFKWYSLAAEGPDNVAKRERDALREKLNEHQLGVAEKRIKAYKEEMRKKGLEPVVGQ